MVSQGRAGGRARQHRSGRPPTDTAAGAAAGRTAAANHRWRLGVAVLALLAAVVPPVPALGDEVRGYPDVEVVAPTEAAPTISAPGEPLDVTFTATRRGWRYEVRLRPGGDDGDGVPAGGSGATGTTELGTNVVAVTLPDDVEAGELDVVVILRTPGRGDGHEVARDHAPAGLHALPAVLPTTGFEDRGGPDRTTHDEELAFVDEVAAASPRVTVTDVGTTLEGRVLQLARIGFPRPPADDDITAGRSVLLIGGQHGNEPAGREMALQLLRDLAFTRDAELLDQLDGTTVLIVPSANPDGSVADTRGNTDGIDINRDHVGFRTNEGEAMAQVMRRFTPDLVIDAHEGPSTPENPGQVPRLELSWPRNLNVDDQVRGLSASLVEDHVLPAADAAGYVTGIYGSPGGAGGGDERIGRNAIGLRHHLATLIETFNATAVDRVELQLLAAEEALTFHREHLEDIAAAVEGAPDRRAADGAAREPFYVGGSDWEPPTDGDVLDPAPCGYLINTVQADRLERTFGLFGVGVEQVSDIGVFVTMAQPMMTVVPLLVDARAPFNEVEAVALDDCTDPGSQDPPPLPPPPTEPGQWSTDFSDDEVGEAPAGWSTLWRDSSWTVLDDPSRLRHEVTAGAGRRALTIDDVGDDGHVQGDVEIAGLVRADQVGETVLQLGFHYGGEPGDEQAYYLDARTPGASSGANSVRIGRYRDGAFVGLSTVQVPFTITAGTWYHVVLQRQDDQLRAKMWPDGQDEPAGWQATANDGSFDGGRVGVSHFTSGTINDWAFVGVGTGGEPAPRAPEGTVPPQPTPTEPGQWSTDFSEIEVGEMPDGWSPQWRDSDWTVLDDPSRLRHTVRGDDGQRRALVWTEVGDDGDGGLVRGDVEVAGLVRTEDAGATMLQLGLHYGGQAGAENAYYLDVRSAGQLRLNAYLGGTHSGQGTANLPFTPENGTWYHVVLQREGHTLRAKMWPDGQDEPDGWMVTGSNVAFDEGYVGVSHFTNGTINDWAFIGVGTGGEPAPRPD